jgi:ribonuclease HI
VLGVIPLNLRRKELKLNYAIKVLHDKNQPANQAFNYKGPGMYMERGKRLQPTCWKTEEEINDNPLLTEAMRMIKPFQAILPPWELVQLETNVDLAERHEKLTNDHASLGLATNYIDRVKGTGMEIYTDGSKDEHGNVGVGVYVPEWNIKKQYKVTNNVSIFTAEMLGILKALEILTENPPILATIFTDSLSSVQSLRGSGSSCRPDIEEEILQLNTRLKHAGCSVTVAWIPAHIGIYGNERVDKEANAGRDSKSFVEVGLIRSEVRNIVKESINNAWVTQWKESKKGRMTFYVFNLPTRKSQITTKLKIPMNRKLLTLRLGGGSFRWKNRFCYACMEHNTIQHLFECVEYETERRDLDAFCTTNDIAMLAETLLDTRIMQAVQSLLKQFIARVNINI